MYDVPCYCPGLSVFELVLGGATTPRTTRYDPRCFAAFRSLAETSEERNS